MTTQHPSPKTPSDYVAMVTAADAERNAARVAQIEVEAERAAKVVEVLSQPNPITGCHPPLFHAGVNLRQARRIAQMIEDARIARAEAR